MSEVAYAGARQESHAVSAHGIEHGVADGNQPGAKQDGDAERREALGDRKHQDELKPRRQKRQDSEDKNRRNDRTHHILLAVTAPNRP